VIQCGGDLLIGWDIKYTFGAEATEYRQIQFHYSHVAALATHIFNVGTAYPSLPFMTSI
jgi:hypothetical protein